MNLPKEFQCCNQWKEDWSGEKWASGRPRYIIDQSTGQKYWNEPKKTIRAKCVGLVFGTPIVYAAPTMAVVAVRTLKLVSFYHFWIPSRDGTPYKLKGRLKKSGKNLGKLLLQPLALIGLESAALYGVVCPRDGKKLYAAIINSKYNSKYTLAPCFQPDPHEHLLGGYSGNEVAW